MCVCVCVCVCVCIETDIYFNPWYPLLRFRFLRWMRLGSRFYATSLTFIYIYMHTFI